MDCQVCLDDRRCLICGGHGRAVVASVSTSCAACGGSGRCHACSATAAVGAKAIPRQVRPAAAEAGRVGAAGRVHAVRKTLAGNQAWCGAGPIAALQPGRYDPADDNACTECLVALTG